MSMENGLCHLSSRKWSKCHFSLCPFRNNLYSPLPSPVTGIHCMGLQHCYFYTLFLGCIVISAVAIVEWDHWLCVMPTYAMYMCWIHVQYTLCLVLECSGKLATPFVTIANSAAQEEQRLLLMQNHHLSLQHCTSFKFPEALSACHCLTNGNYYWDFEVVILLILHIQISCLPQHFMPVLFSTSMLCGSGEWLWAANCTRLQYIRTVFVEQTFIADFNCSYVSSCSGFFSPWVLQYTKVDQWDSSRVMLTLGDNKWPKRQLEMQA